jgi:hypothetical protein
MLYLSRYFIYSNIYIFTRYCILNSKNNHFHSHPSISTSHPLVTEVTFLVWIPDSDGDAGDGDEWKKVVARRVNKQMSRWREVEADRDPISPAGSTGSPDGAGSWLAGF